MKILKLQILSINSILFTLLISFCYNYLIIPFTIKSPSIKTENNFINASEYLEYIKNNLIATKIYMGTPEKEIEIYLTTEIYEFLLGKGFCLQNPNSSYDPTFSSTYDRGYISVISYLFNNGTQSTDNFIFYNNLNLTQNNSVEEMDFIYGIASNDIFNIIYPDKICGYLGLQFPSSEYFEYHSFIYKLKSKNKIKNKHWSIIFYDNEKEKINNYDGFLALGINESDYKTFFNNENDYNTTYSAEYGYQNKFWEIKFNEIYYYINKQNYSFFTDISAQIIIDYNYIKCSEAFFNSTKINFFNKYIDKGICKIDKSKNIIKTNRDRNQLINIIICDKKKFKDMKKFPTLYFKNIYLYTIFEFNYKDLFQEIGNSLIFSIVYDEESRDHWALGRIFLKKYQFIFDNDQRTITYIKRNKRKDNKNNNITNIILKIMLIVFLLIGFGAGIFVGKKLWDKNRKKRANELADDEYDYKVDE